MASDTDSENSNALTKDKLAAHLVQSFGVSKTDALLFVNGFFETIADSLKSGEEVMLSGFGKFKLMEKNVRLGRNPKTNEPAEISARRVTSFKPAKQLARDVKDATKK